jgi:hypothetical protein
VALMPFETEKSGAVVRELMPAVYRGAMLVDGIEMTKEVAA